MANKILELIDRAISGAPEKRDALADIALEVLGEKSLTPAQVKAIGAAQKRYDDLGAEITRLASMLGNRGFERQALATAQLVAEGRGIDTIPVYTRDGHDLITQEKSRF